ncbi:integral membrane sensor hybrid histidine kinase [Chloroherpeton thalassium ATCC 35110]|uniref:histidine kinase n=1 Tax=Chloroherpeton thalassium (strain ATCC 35110 / GB-78) TaxID=517418 RepID=B3QVS1_CHLT3|nr:response regulator [Chloroherpeton thalassium]ACF13128.1 integral membrane sensor hybrid histidine kinase [Chloroherpeton thalassium ATCC 35110]
MRNGTLGLIRKFFLIDLLHDGKEIEEARKLFLINFVAIFAVLVLCGISSYSFLTGNVLVGSIDILTAIFISASLTYLRITGKQTVPLFIGLASIGSLYFYLFLTGGASNTGFLWYYTFPVFTIYLLGMRNGLFATMALFLPSFIYLIYSVSQPDSLYSLDFAVRFIPSVFCVFIFAYHFERTRANAYVKLEQKRLELEKMIEALVAKENELTKAHNELEIKIAERTQELQSSNEQLAKEVEERKNAEQDRQKLEEQLVRAEKMEAVGTLAGGIANHLNNLLSGIVTYPELLLNDLPPNSPLREPLMLIKSSGERAAEIVQDLLTLSRRGVTYKQNLNINQVVIEIFQSKEFERIKKHFPDVKFNCKLSHNLFNMKGSFLNLQRAITNLMSNAAESILNEGVVSVSTENRYVDSVIHSFEIIQEGEYVVIEVEDSGQGIPMEEHDRIFEPYYTVKNLGNTSIGLGLSLVWGIVKDHDGYIDVKSVPNKGSRFTLYFPAKRQEPAANIDVITPVMGNGESILIVDDISEQRLITKSILEKLGYDTLLVETGEAAVAFVRHHKVDLIILDMIMSPGMDGLDTFKEIRKINPKQKVLITSGHPSNPRVKEAQELGAGEYIKKPFSILAIGKAIREALMK